MPNAVSSYIKLKIGIGFGLGLFVLISVQYVSNKSIKRVLTSQQALRRSSELSTQLESIKSSLIFFESKIKSYTLTGESSFLDRSTSNLRNIFAGYDSLSKLSPNENQAALIKESKSLTYQEVAFAQQILTEYEQDPARAIAFIKTGKGIELISRLTSVLDNIRNIEAVKFSELIAIDSVLTSRVVQMDIAAYLFAFLLIGISILILFHDITKREALQEELLVIQRKAEHASVIKEQFMANMSHEIRTPMNAIIGFTNRLNKTELTSEQSEYIAAVRTSGQNLLSIINDILDFSKIEAGMVRIEEIRFDLPGLLHSVCTMFDAQAKERHLAFRLQLNPELPESVSGDPTRLTQILINLIGNALKFTEQGSIDISASVVKEDERTVLIRFLVKDTGIGIPEDKISEIFERFTQAKSDTNRIFGGTGLGLSIVKKLVELQKGTITVKSISGQGSEFTVEISYRKAAAEKVLLPLVSSDSTLLSRNSRIRILVVEDNLLNQKLAGFILKEWGFQFDIAANGKIALEKLRESNYDLILMDLQMPELNGYDTTLVIRQDLKLTIPIIAMTAHALPGEKEKCLTLGMTDYLSKPINEIELFDLLTKHLFTANTKF
ncbi:MAG TPA: ATP-binding protein [Bacteroidia bacterium]|jgi:signal transduction histidine kinase/ActR/RegA family two-component response regulator|nr:ATP-binding protein [Bacteroidia bacterium]